MPIIRFKIEDLGHETMNMMNYWPFWIFTIPFCVFSTLTQALLNTQQDFFSSLRVAIPHDGRRRQRNVMCCCKESGSGEQSAVWFTVSAGGGKEWQILREPFCVCLRICLGHSPKFLLFIIIFRSKRNPFSRVWKGIDSEHWRHRMIQAFPSVQIFRI